MKNFDYYGAARDLIAHLNRDGYLSEASRLQSAMDEGATGTEILMALYFHISDIASRIQLKEDSQELAYRLLSELKKSVG